MNKIVKKIAKLLTLRRTRNTTIISQCLDADSQSYVGAIPSTPIGQSGHFALLDVYFNLIATSKPAIFCDIGANKGEAGRRALELRPEMKVFGFEANPNIHERYKKINVDAGVQWLNCAVADKEGSLLLHIPKVLSRALEGDILVAKRVTEAEDTGKSSLLKRDETAEYESVKVRSVTLDSFLKDHAPTGRVALWIDVEGAASIVLEGALETLARTDVLVIEVEGFPFWQDQALVMQVMDQLYAHGFVPVLRDREYHDAQFNIIFLRNDKGLDLQQHKIGNILEKSRNISTFKMKYDQEITPNNVPVLVPCFNNPSYTENMLVQLQSFGFSNITFVDNASSSLTMQKWLSELAQRGVQVERLAENLGPRESIFTPERLAKLPRWFCVTDPDLQFNLSLPNDFLEIMAEALVRHRMPKVGFALDIGRRQELRSEKFDVEGTNFHIWEWEKQFWSKALDLTSSNDTVFEAPVDTTFALYDLTRFKKDSMLRALRIGGRFTATHLPWLLQQTMLDEEDKFYRASQKFSWHVR